MKIFRHQYHIQYQYLCSKFSIQAFMLTRHRRGRLGARGRRRWRPWRRSELRCGLRDVARSRVGPGRTPSEIREWQMGEGQASAFSAQSANAGKASATCSRNAAQIYNRADNGRKIFAEDLDLRRASRVGDDRDLRRGPRVRQVTGSPKIAIVAGRRSSPEIAIFGFGGPGKNVAAAVAKPRPEQGRRRGQFGGGR